MYVPDCLGSPLISILSRSSDLLLVFLNLICTHESILEEFSLTSSQPSQPSSKIDVLSSVIEPDLCSLPRLFNTKSTEPDYLNHNNKDTLLANEVFAVHTTGGRKNEEYGKDWDDLLVLARDVAKTESSFGGYLQT